MGGPLFLIMRSTPLSFLMGDKPITVWLTGRRSCFAANSRDSDHRFVLIKLQHKKQQTPSESNRASPLWRRTRQTLEHWGLSEKEKPDSQIRVGMRQRPHLNGFWGAEYHVYAQDSPLGAGRRVGVAGSLFKPL